MPQELKFPDPAFHSEVVLSGVAKALYESAQQQFERLKGIKSLGLMASVRDVAMQTRHQHVVGLMRIFNKLYQQPKDKGLPKTFLWSFWVRLCFSQVGHASLSYDAEKAVLLACHLDVAFKQELRQMLQPVIDKPTGCAVCTKPCDVTAKGSAEAGGWFDELVEHYRWDRLHLWFAALKLLQNASLLGILNQQRIAGESRHGFSEPEAFKLLIAPGCAWSRPLRNLSRLDFVVRDLTFAGTLGIQFDVDNLVAAANSAHPDWRLLDHLSQYMSETLYESTAAQTSSTLLQRALASLLLKRKVSLASLFGTDPANSFSDDDLQEVMVKSAGGREAFHSGRRSSWRAWPINTLIEQQTRPCDLERRITGQTKGYLTHHVSSYATCFKMQQKNGLAIAISHADIHNRPHAKTFVKLCRSVLNCQYPNVNASHLTKALFEGLLDRTCKHSVDDTTERLSTLGVDLTILRGAANVVNSRALSNAENVEELGLRIGGFEYRFRSAPQTVEISTMHAALSADDAFRRMLNVTQTEAAEMLWDELLAWQTVFFGKRPSQRIRRLVQASQRVLGLNVVSNTQNAAKDLELYVLLEALDQPAAGVSFRVALPNLKLLKEDGTIENEYDVVSVVLKDDREVEVWVWGVTTEANVGPKRQADLTKIQRLKDLLAARWQQDVRVVTCYVHREATDICLDVAGRPERRTLAP